MDGYNLFHKTLTFTRKSSFSGSASPWPVVVLLQTLFLEFLLLLRVPRLHLVCSKDLHVVLVLVVVVGTLIIEKQQQQQVSVPGSMMVTNDKLFAPCSLDCASPCSAATSGMRRCLGIMIMRCLLYVQRLSRL